jgi:anaerobic selenocysteine-containing dehydrogenase
MTQWPNTNMVKAALEAIPFVVTVEHYLTSTALYSDLVLPCTGMFEMEGVLANARSHWVQLVEKAVDGPGQCKSDLEIFTELATASATPSTCPWTPSSAMSSSRRASPWRS